MIARISPHVVLRLAVAVLLSAQAALHLRLWFDGYRQLPTIGPLFLVGAVTALVVAVLVMVRPHPIVLAAGALVSAGQAGALVASSTIGLFGFATVWTWGGDQGATVFAEIVTLAALFGLARWRERTPAASAPSLVAVHA